MKYGVVYPILRVILRSLMFILGPLRVRRREALPREGGLLILANHIADFDPPIVQLTCKRPMHFMAKSELFEMPSLKRIIRWFNAFPVKRGEPDRASIKYAIDLLTSGEVVCIFPEGQLSEDGKMQPLLPGAALIVRKAGVPVVCCGLRNTNKILPYGNIIPKPSFHFTYAHWGEVKSFEKSAKADEIIGWAETQLHELTGQQKAATD